jgi:xylulose-5-phosphate/fructose-6-phosphate phosphoketolase
VAAAHLKEWLKDRLIEHTNYAPCHGIDKPGALSWKWPFGPK